MEYNPMEELGFFSEKQIVVSCNGILTRNDYARTLCGRFIKNGEHIFDILSRYEDLITYALTRENSNTWSTMKMILPFLKAYGITDHMAYEFGKETLDIVPGAADMMHYVNSLMPTYIITGSLIHHTMNLVDALDFSFDNVFCTQVDFDASEMDKQEGRKIREIATRLSAMRIPKTFYTMSDAKYLDDDDARIVSELDKDFQDVIPNMNVGEAFKNVTSVGSNEKAYRMLEIRKSNDIGFESTVYVGNGISDHQALDLVRDSDGLAISFNGSEYAVRGCNVMVLSNNVSVINLLVSEFFNEGIGKVYDLIENWDRKKLENYPCSDKHLLNGVLSTFPKKLPVVKRVTRKNVNECILQSEEYRKKVMR